MHCGFIRVVLCIIKSSFNSQIIFHCVVSLLICPFINWWIFGLFPLTGYYCPKWRGLILNSCVRIAHKLLSSVRPCKQPFFDHGGGQGFVHCGEVRSAPWRTRLGKRLLSQTWAWGHVGRDVCGPGYLEGGSTVGGWGVGSKAWGSGRGGSEHSAYV